MIDTRVEHARAADLVAPHLLHARHAGIGDVLLDGGRAHHRAVARHLVGTAAHRRHAEHDRIVAVVDRLDVEHRDLAHAAGIVAGPFAERPFRMRAVGRHVAFEHDLGVGREGQAGDLAAHHLDRFAAQAADEVELEHAVRRFEPAEEERDRIAAQHGDARQRLAALERLVAVDAAVMARPPSPCRRFSCRAPARDRRRH